MQLEWGESDYFGNNIREVVRSQIPLSLLGYYKDFIFKSEQNEDQLQGFKHSLAKIYDLDFEKIMLSVVTRTGYM